VKTAFAKFDYNPADRADDGLRRLMSRCVGAGHDVHLLTASWEDEPTLPVTRHGITVERYTRAAKLAAFSLGVEEFLRLEPFDVVLSFERTGSQDIFCIQEGVYPVWREQRRNWLPKWGNNLDACRRTHRVQCGLEEKAVEEKPFLIAPSQMVKRDLLTVYPELDASKISVIYDGLDTGCFSAPGRLVNRRSVCDYLDIRRDECLLLFVAERPAQQGLRELLQALVELPDCFLLVLGVEHVSGWRRMARRLDVRERVIFHPMTEDLKLFYHAAQATVIPSWYEPFSRAGLESLSCGTPVVTSAFSGLAEWIQPGVNGAVCSFPGQVAELAEAIRTGLSIFNGPAVSDTVRHLTEEANVQQMLDVIDRVHRAKQEGLC